MMDAPLGYTESEALTSLEYQKVESFGLTSQFHKLVYKTATATGGNNIKDLLNNDNSSNNATYSFSVGPNEAICPYSVQAKMIVGFTIGENENWVMTADGIRPVGTPVTWAVCKPKTVNGATNNDGIRLPRYPLQSQLQWITTSVGSDAGILEDASTGHRAMATNWTSYAALQHFCCESAVSTGFHGGVLDGRSTDVDACGSSLFTKQEVDTTSNAFIDRFYRLKSSSESKLSFEKLFLRDFADGGDALFKPGGTQTANFKFLPPGCPLYFQMSLMSSVNRGRLDTGLLVSVGDGAGANFVDAKVYLKFQSVVFRAQAVQLTAIGVDDFLAQSVLYSHIGMREVNASKDMYPTVPKYKAAPAWRAAFADIDIQKYDVANGSTTLNWNVLPNKQYLPDFMVIFTTSSAVDPFALPALSKDNWDLSSFVTNKLKTVKVTTGDNAKDRPEFLDMLPGNDYNADDLSEQILLLDASNHQLAGNMIFKMDGYSQLLQQTGTALATWLKRGYTFDQLPGQNAFVSYVDTTSAIVPDLGSGSARDTMSLDITFTEAANSLRLFCVMFRRSVVTLDIESRPAILDESTSDESDRKYQLNRLASGVAVAPQSLATIGNE